MAKVIRACEVCRCTTEGDSFIGAFHDPADAVGFAVNLQLAMLAACWPDGLSEHPSSMRVALHQLPGYPVGLTDAFHGLRVRAIVHSGIPTAVEVGRWQDYLSPDWQTIHHQHCADCESFALPALVARDFPEWASTVD